MGGSGECAVGRGSVADVGVENHIRARMLAQPRRVRFRRLRGVDNGGQRLVVDLDQLGGILRDRQRLGDHEHDRLADIVHLADGERIIGGRHHRPVAVDENHIGICALRLGWGRERRVGRDRLATIRLVVGAGEHREHATQRLRARRIDRLDARMRVHRTDHEGARLARQIDVIAEAAGADDEPRILLAANGLTDSLALRHALSPPRLHLIGEEAPQAVAHVVRLRGRPFAKAFAALHAELAGGDLRAQERMRPGGAVEIGHQHLADVEREVEADEIGLLHRPEHRHARAEPRLHHRVEGLGIADARRDERDRLALQGVLQPVADEARNVAAHMHRRLAGGGQELDRACDHRFAGLLVLDHLDQRHEMRRIPEMRADDAVAVLEIAPDLGRGDRRAVAGEDGVGRGEAFEIQQKSSASAAAFPGAASNTKVASFTAGASWSCTVMRVSTAASSPSRSRIDARRCGIDARMSADGSKMPASCPAAASR